MKKKRVLIITPNALHNGPRLIREIDALKEEYEITAIGTTPPHDPVASYIPFSSIQYGWFDKVVRKVNRILFKRPFLANLPVKEQRIHNLLKSVDPDFVIAHSPIELPYLFSFPKRKFQIVYNAHEYHPLEFDSDIKWLNNWGRLYTHIYGKYLSQVDLLINVCDSIAEKCEQEYGKKSLVIPNAATFYPDVKPFKNRPDAPVRIIHHGGSIVERKIEIMIDAVASLGNEYQLDLMLMESDKVYHQFLKDKIAGTSNVQLIEPVSYQEIVPFINQYDIGLYNLPPNNYNERIALPNKLFEYIQARLAIVIGPSVEMQRVIKKYDLGMVSDNFTAGSIAQTIREMDRNKIWSYKLNADKAAKVVSAENDQRLFKEAVKNLN